MNNEGKNLILLIVSTHSLIDERIIRFLASVSECTTYVHLAISRTI